MEASTIGIIGGADGPTAIFLASPWNPVLLAAGLLIVLAAVLWLYRRKNRK